MSKSHELTRRTMLRGLGTALALPWLEGMVPAAFAAEGAAAATPPQRLAFMYVPNGVHMQDWTPTGEGSGFPLPHLLEPLADLRGDFSILTGLTQQKANANGDGPGDHARALTTFLTGCQARKTHGADIRAGVSADQVAAEQIGRQTRFPSLELGCDAGAQSGNCDSGYSCAYSSNIAWKSETQPLVKENNPRQVFERLFTNGRPGETAEARARRERSQKSVLDFVNDDARRLRVRLGGADQRKLDEYLGAVRELELRVQAASKPGNLEALAGAQVPAGIPSDYGEHIRLMGDLMVLAFRTDVTRVATFVIANEGSNKSYAFIDVPEGHHDLSHHGNDAGKHEKIKKINRFHLEQLAYILKKLKSTTEGSGSLLDHCQLVYGSGIGDGNAHNHDNLPVLLAGRAGGQLQQGRHVKYDNGTPLNNLFLSMLDLAGVHREKMGDSTGKLSGLTA
ncbi:MAG: DUF1552 domain-containing protein [Planctomycetaceae bacterium]|jgi:hypothetical protein